MFTLGRVCAWYMGVLNREVLIQSLNTKAKLANILREH